MNKYKVKVSHIFNEILDVEADDENSAKEKAIDILKNNDRQSEVSYETTLSKDHWPVITEKQFNDFIEKLKQEPIKEENTNK